MDKCGSPGPDTAGLRTCRLGNGISQVRPAALMRKIAGSASVMHDSMHRDRVKRPHVFRYSASNAKVPIRIIISQPVGAVGPKALSHGHRHWAKQEALSHALILE